MNIHCQLPKLTYSSISALVTIASAAKSSDPKVVEQVPEHLRQSRTLVLCPSSLVENWFEEFAKWTPPDSEEYLGPVYKIVTLQSPFERLHIIQKWHVEGGVLIISYDLFKALALPEKPEKVSRNKRSVPVKLVKPVKRPSHFDLKDQEAVVRQLTEGPNIIVADEAHKLKNKHTGVALACSKFKSKSRIALTGSPLSNHLHDYYAMIDWIAPRYLGDPAHFRAKYEDPIKKGLYSESTPSDRRRALMKLQVLKKDLEPKVNRHDISVLKGSIAPKVEFVITVAMTEIQEKAYAIYIEGLQDRSDNNVRVTNWLNNLSVLCNHPACFHEKLKEPPKPVKGAAQRLESDTDNPQADMLSEVPPESPNSDDSPIARLLTPEALVRLNQLFEPIQDLASLVYSHRMRIIRDIIHETIKAGDKILVFSHSIPTLNYIGGFLGQDGINYNRLDGETAIGGRQAATKSFNDAGADIPVYLISTKAGGVGLNIQGANRVILVDFRFNPSDEEQAVGRAFRFGQKKPVFVYHLINGGTFEDVLHNQSVFKMQLASRVVDKKNPIPWASRSKDYLFPPKKVDQKDLSEYHGRDKVLDAILAKEGYIRKISLTETFQVEDNVAFTEEELRDVRQELEDQRLQREDPDAWAKKNSERAAAAALKAPVPSGSRRVSNGTMGPPRPPGRPRAQQTAAPTQPTIPPPLPMPTQQAQQQSTFVNYQPGNRQFQRADLVTNIFRQEPPALAPDMSLHHSQGPSNYWPSSTPQHTPQQSPIMNGHNFFPTMNTPSVNGHPPSSSATAAPTGGIPSYSFGVTGAHQLHDSFVGHSEMRGFPASMGRIAGSHQHGVPFGANLQMQVPTTPAGTNAQVYQNDTPMGSMSENNQFIEGTGNQVGGQGQQEVSEVGSLDAAGATAGEDHGFGRSQKQPSCRQQ